MSNEIEETKKKLKRKRKTTKKKTVVDSAARNAAKLTDGCNPEFVKGAEFDGIFEMPIIKRPKKIIIPQNLVPFSNMGKDRYGNEWHVRNNADGTRDWVRHQNQVINEGGRNSQVIPWDSETGLYRNVKKIMKRKR